MKLIFLLLIFLGCSAAGQAAPPRIRLNSDFLLNQTEVVLSAGSAFSIGCHGNGSERWSSSALRLVVRRTLENPVEVVKSEPRYTGTYRCGYANQSLGHLDTWVHLYIKDVTHPFNVFVTPRSKPAVKEGQDFLFRCLLTDPSVTNLTLQSVDSATDRGQGLPPGMKVTFDPRRGALIHGLQTSFSGRYRCAGLKEGRQVRSTPFDLRVSPSLRFPPNLSVSQDEVTRLVGEKFQVTCLARNPSHSYTVTWTDHNAKTLSGSTRQYYSNQLLFINNTLTLMSVNETHSGKYTCTAVNEAGVTTATTQLTVLDRPFLRIYLLSNANLNATANANSSSTEVSWGLVANVSGSFKVNMEQSMNFSRVIISGRSTVEAFEGRDLTLTFLIEAYPPITTQRWTTPAYINNNHTVYNQTNTTNSYRSSLQLHRVRPEDRGRLSFCVSNEFFSVSEDVYLQIYHSPHVAISMENDTLTCSSSGYPLPTILWFTCPGIHDSCEDVSTNQVWPADDTSQEGGEVREYLAFPLSPGDDVTVECVAYNHLGKTHDAFTARSGRPAWFFTPALIGSLSTIGFLLLLLIVVFYKWRKKPKYEIRWKIIESTDGNNYTFVDPSQLPYNHKWEFPRDKLRLGPVLGSGAFGKVVEATAFGLDNENKSMRVAVKMLKPSAHSEEREALMSELKILSYLGSHDNIVNLLGACTRGGPMLMITEYCCHGDLLNFLRGHAQDFMASVLTEGDSVYKNMAAQQTRLRSDSGISCCSEYQEMLPVLNPGQTHLGGVSDSLSLVDLMMFSHHVAQGLDFLSTRNCIHRDVAARNVLLTDRHVAKICDFGLARDIRNDDSYIVQGNARLPVKWMSPESIFQCIYTVQSDVWSYGVLLWEIFSLGKSPYPNVAVDTNFYKMIKDGGHMTRPDFAPAEMYQLMTACWSLEPTDRPTFKMIGQLINSLFPSTNDRSHHSEQLTYRNIDACREEQGEEEEEDALKAGEEEHCVHRDHTDDDDDQLMRKNIYQLS